MTSFNKRPRGAIFLACAAALLANPQALAQTDPAALPADKPGAADDLLGPGHWRLVVSPFSHHFRYSAEHRYVWAAGVERQRSDNWLAGISYFRNSFGQPSNYTYVGRRFTALWDQPQLFAQVSGGMLNGYRGKYEDKVPLNHKGISPGALVSLGWQFNKDYAATAHLLGDAGLMIQLSLDLH